MRENEKRVIVMVGTYDGVLAAWESSGENRKLNLTLASPVHQGSVRSLSVMSPSPSTALDGTHPAVSPSQILLLSCGYDEMLKTHDFSKQMSSTGEVRTPADLGTPSCSTFTPDGRFALVGFAENKGSICVYKKRDWSVQHILGGHAEGVSAIAVHPSSKLALSGGSKDGKVKVWDLSRGRLAYTQKIQQQQQKGTQKGRIEPITSIIWHPVDGTAYGWCYGSHITVQDVATGSPLLDVELPSRVNEICWLSGADGDFIAAACNDGSLPVLKLRSSPTDDSSATEIKAIMAIEPVDQVVAGVERFKCIQQVGCDGYQVVTANSAGVVSWLDLSGAVNMILTGDDGEDEEDMDSNKDGPDEVLRIAEREGDDSSTAENEELAVDFIDSVQLGSGARLTCLKVWSSLDETPSLQFGESKEVVEQSETTAEAPTTNQSDDIDDIKKRPRAQHGRQTEMSAEEVKKARELVAVAKELQHKKKKRRKKKSQQ